MNPLLEQLAGSLLQGKNLDQISDSLGIDSATAQKILSAAVPMILGGLLKNSKSGNGLQDLFKAIVKDHDGSAVDNISDVINNPTKGGGILEHVLGDQRSTIENQIGQSSGLDMAKISRILKIAAPIILAIIGKQRMQNDWNAKGMQESLQQANNELTQQAPKEVSILERMLDSDGDGSMMDDLAGIGVNIFKQWMRG